MKTNFTLKSLFFIYLFVAELLSAQTLVHHTTNWFGPNANPVPEFTDATIPKETQLTVMGDYYFGFGDTTINPSIKIEVSLTPLKQFVNTHLILKNILT